MSATLRERCVFVFLVLQLVTMRGCIGFPIVWRVVRTLRRILAYAAALLLLIPAMLPANKQFANWASEVGVEMIAALALGQLKVLRGGR